MLHKVVLQELLEDDLSVARDRLAGRICGIALAGSSVLCRFEAPGGGGEYCLRLSGRAYDAEPFRLAVVDDAGDTLPADRWPPGLYHSQHPILGVPFACVQGTYEYHTHPGHIADVWDRYRHRIRLADLLDHLLRKSGR